MTDQPDIAKDVLDRLAAVSSDRGNWEAHWEEIARRVLPQYTNTFQTKGMQTTTGERKTEGMVDATAALALPKFAAAMESMLTPRGQTWHRLAPVDPTVLRNRAARAYYDDINALLFRYRYAPRANFASQMHEIYMGLGAFGTGVMYVDALTGNEPGLRYRTIHLGEAYLVENHQGVIDTIPRQFMLTAQQAKQKFGDTLPKAIEDEANKPGGLTKKFQFVHYVAPRDDYEPRRRDAKGMPFCSYYVSVTGKALVKQDGSAAPERGYHVFPYPVGRYVMAPGEVYGRSPAMMALPTIRVLNEMKRTVLKQGHRTVDPILLTHDDGVVNGLSMRPGAVNAGGVTADGKPLVHVLPMGKLELAKEMMEAERAVINDAFLVTLFQILIETPQMTATEVLERAREKGALLSPTMGRQQSEFLGPLIERELDVLAAQGLLPPMPDIVRQADQEHYQPIYDSPLSRAQRAEEATGFLQVMNWARDIVSVTQDPSPLDNFKLDTAIPAMARIGAVREDWLNTDEEKQAIRDARAKQQQQQQMIDAAPSLASAAKALPQVSTRLTGNA